MPAPDFAVEIAALEQAMAAGELTVESDGERVTYQNFTEIQSRLNYFKQRARDMMGPRTRTGSGSSYAVFDRDN